MSPNSYFFPWQNPVLRKTIYPFRDEKLRDFLLIYKEIDLWKEMKSLSMDDPIVMARIQKMETQTRLERQQISVELTTAIQARISTDSWFARITGDEIGLKNKRIYYLDRVIQEYTVRLGDLEARRKALLRNTSWYKEGDSRIELWKNRARELDLPIEAVRQELDSLTGLRSLFDRLDRLPKLEKTKPITPADLARGDLSAYQKELDALDHDALVEKVWERLTEKMPDGKPRFKKWLQYMVIHFSGMRYMSAHASWADPDDLLEVLIREDLKEKLAPGDDIDDKTETEIHRLLTLPADEKTKNLNPTLKALVYYKQQKERQGEPIPDWVWDEVEKYTQLRLGVDSENWESISPERYKFENRRWREVMDSWQREDITIWRQKHKQTLDLIVTRAVCNEISEHIQHLRGVVPAAGLTSKPNWYLRLQEETKNLPLNDTKKCYFRSASTEKDFMNGASILWLGWTEVQPNAWQVALPLKNIELWPGLSYGNTQVVKGQKGEVPKKQLEQKTDDWQYEYSNGAFIRTHKIIVQVPTARELQKRGMTEREINEYRKNLRTQNTVEKEYLRWKHEAIAIDVVDRIDGKYILTFETGKIGLNWHYVGDMVRNSFDRIFIGFKPEADQEPDNLPKMLDHEKILTVFETPKDLEFSYGLDQLNFDVVEPSSIVETSDIQVIKPKFTVYILSNKAKKTLYISATSDLIVRLFEHRNRLLPGVPKRPKLSRLVYYHVYDDLEEAIAISNAYRNASRSMIVDLITASNPGWRDLSDEVF